MNKTITKTGLDGKSKFETMHLPENLILVATERTRGGIRFFFRCPSRKNETVATASHLFSVNADGSEPKCTCRSFEHRDRCGLSDASERIAFMHRG